MKEKTLTVILLLALVLIIIGPLAIIWALNTLFPALAIAYSIETWFAVCIVSGLFKTQLTFKQ